MRHQVGVAVIRRNLAAFIAHLADLVARQLSVLIQHGLEEEGRDLLGREDLGRLRSGDTVGGHGDRARIGGLGLAANAKVNRKHSYRQLPTNESGAHDQQLWLVLVNRKIKKPCFKTLKINYFW